MSLDGQFEGTVQQLVETFLAGSLDGDLSFWPGEADLLLVLKVGFETTEECHGCRGRGRVDLPVRL